MNFKTNEVPQILKKCTDTRWTNRTIYNHYESPMDFMQSVIDLKDHEFAKKDKTQKEIRDGIAKFKRIQEKDVTYSTLFRDVAQKVRNKLLTRGFTTAMLYSSVEFTTENTGVMSKQRAMLGRRDCFFKNPGDSGRSLFHDIYINLSYCWDVEDSTITRNSYALYALTRELSRVLPMRVIVVNHVGTDIPTCYSYVLKKFGQPIKPDEFLFFTSDSKRTFGWATYAILNNGQSSGSTVGQPKNTVPIDKFNLDRVIDDVFVKVKQQAPGMFKVV